MSGAPPEGIVAFLSERADLFGGGQASLCDLVVALRSTTWRPLVLLPGPGALSETLDAQGIAWRIFRTPPFASPSLWRPPRSLARLRRIVRESGAAVLHSDAPRGALYAGLAGRLTGVPHLFHVRAQHPSSALADHVLEGLSDRVVAVSRAAASRSAALRASGKVRVVPTGLPPIDFLPRAEARLLLDLPPDDFVCGVVGRVEEEKGRADAVQALGAVRRAAPGALLAFLGSFDPDDPWARTCALRAAAAGQAGGVRLLGSRPRAARLMRAFDLLLHPSHHEALPRVVIEAQLASVPVVAARVGGLPEIIESGTNGVLVPARHGIALGAAAAALAQDPGERRRLAENARASALARFSLDRMVAELTAIYSELTAGSGARRAPTVPASVGSGGAV